MTLKMDNRSVIHGDFDTRNTAALPLKEANVCHYSDWPFKHAEFDGVELNEKHAEIAVLKAREKTRTTHPFNERNTQ
jgi:hypothetical protein